MYFRGKGEGAEGKGAGAWGERAAGGYHSRHRMRSPFIQRGLCSLAGAVKYVTVNLDGGRIGRELGSVGGAGGKESFPRERRWQRRSFVMSRCGRNEALGGAIGPL